MSLADYDRDPALEWLDHVQPTGLVVAPALLKELILTPLPQRAADSAEAARFIDPDRDRPAISDFWGFAAGILGWEVQLVAGSPGGPEVPIELAVHLPEHETTLRPTLAVASRDDERPWQILVSLVPAGADPDARGALSGWEATAHQRFERLLRDTGVFSGLLVSDRELRLVHAPRGETSGWISFPIRPLATVAGRPMLGGLKLMLDRARLFTDATDRRLPALLKRSRDAQAAVSSALAGQVLGALHELLRGLDAADALRIRGLAAGRPDHLYEGLLAVMLRLVFALYAEDRDLLPSLTDARARELYERNYSLRGLYAKLTEDAALNPDTMEGRFGGWGQLLALFRLVHGGHASGFVQRRGGRLFDPDAHPFLEGRSGAGDPPRVLPVSDGCVLRVLHDLMTVEARGRGRERLSYRTLDVEQIGSVYETVMGFTVVPASEAALAIRAGKNNRVPVYVDLAELRDLKGKERVKRLKEAGRAQLSASMARDVEAARTVADLAAAFDGIVDERGSPRGRLAAEGAPILQPNAERRRTGSHYTPRSLTEPIVRHALKPAFARIGEGATPEAVLDLKVCDPAMGSGAFLVEACRQLGARLVEAWRRHGSLPDLPPDEDEDLHARRLVAQRCLYGVDRNPRAVDLAKLSLWLATLARDHEFTFLDHALREGDSLVGLTRAQIAATHWDASKPPTLVGRLVSDHLREAEAARAEIREKAEWEGEAALRRRLGLIERKLAVARLIGDGVVAAFFTGKKDKERAKHLVALQKAVLGDFGSPRWAETVATLSAGLRVGEHPLRPFHWEVEFPEVFSKDSPGFDSVISNPPFLGGTSISSSHGDSYLSYLKESSEDAGNRADLVSYFLQRIFHLLSDFGTSGIIATNTVAQGDTRVASTYHILAAGGSIIRVVKRLVWPGEATVVVTVLHFSKTNFDGVRTLNGKTVNHINSYLLDSDKDGAPSRLSANHAKTFKGLDIYGSGFLFSESTSARDVNTIADLNRVVTDRPSSRLRICPYIGGQEINSSPIHAFHRYVFDLDDLSETEARNLYPELMAIAEEKVRPERMKLRDNADGMRLKEKWWRFNRNRQELFARLSAMKNALAICRHTPHLSIACLPASVKFSDGVIVFLFEDRASFCTIQCRVHETWARFFGSTIKDDLRYTPSDCFDTFAFPDEFQNSSLLQSAGATYYDHRAEIMASRNDGMTKIYNHFHSSDEHSTDIEVLRDLHATMDRAVLNAYGWSDLAARAEPIFLDETNEDDHTYQGRLFWPSDFRDEVLARLLVLNAERAAAERAAGLVAAPADDEKEEAA